MARRTIYLPDGIESLARANAREGESFSATIARLIEQGVRVDAERTRPDWIGAGEGPGDLAIDAERYLAEHFREHSD